MRTARGTGTSSQKWTWEDGRCHPAVNGEVAAINSRASDSVAADAIRDSVTVRSRLFKGA